MYTRVSAHRWPDIHDAVHTRGSVTTSWGCWCRSMAVHMALHTCVLCVMCVMCASPGALQPHTHVPCTSSHTHVLAHVCLLPTRLLTLTPTSPPALLAHPALARLPFAPPPPAPLHAHPSPPALLTPPPLAPRSPPPGPLHTLGLAHGYWNRCTLQKSSATATRRSWCERHSELMSVPSEPSGHTPGGEGGGQSHLPPPPSDPQVLPPAGRTEDVEAQHAGVRRPFAVAALKTVPEEFAAPGDVPWV